MHSEETRSPSRSELVPRRTLVTRLLLLLLLGMLVVYGLAVLGLWWTSNHVIHTSLEKQALHWVQEMAELGPAVYRARGKRDLLAIENRIGNFPEIAFVRYYDASGSKVLRQYGTVKEVPGITEKQRERLLRAPAKGAAHVFDRSVPVDGSLLAGHYIRVLAPVRVREIPSDGLLNFDFASGEEKVRVIGFIDLGINPALHRDAVKTSLAVGSMVTALLLLVALFIGRRLIQRALMPLTELQTPLAKLARGDTDVRVATQGDAEIVAIGEALNATISALKQRDATLRKLAEHDPLTGLVNRGRFTELLREEVARMDRDGGSSALLFVDLDRFKYVNDIVGHAGGDKLLVQVANLLKSRMRETDVISRFGGDEFTVLARNVTREGALEVAKLIKEIMRDSYFIDQQYPFNVYCSIGVAMISPRGGSAEEVLLRADSACYEAKSGGRNRYHLYEVGDEGAANPLRDIGWSDLIKQALKDDRLNLAYQPIVRIDGQGPEYYEVLLRLPDLDGSTVPPSVFLPVAERFGLLADLDRWVIENAVRALAQFRAEGRDIVFSINLSGQTFDDPAIVKLIHENLRRYALPAGAVVFEITEQIAVRYMEKARRLMHSLTELGCRFSLDDFGVGFSSFNYLKHFPVSFIKIDGSFVENMTHETVDRAMVRSIAQIARALGKETIAEFVQNDATIDLLKQYKVDHVQGYHVGLPAETLPHRRFAQQWTRKVRRVPS